MTSKLLSILSVCVAVIAASVSAVIVTQKRADAARAAVARAESEESAAKSAERKAKAEANAEASKAAAKESESKAAEEKRKASELDRETAELEAKKAADEKERAQAEAAAAKDRARAAADLRAAEKEKTDAVRVACNSSNEVARAALAKAESEERAAADRLAAEKIKAEAIVAEAKALELRKIDFETFERQLLEYKQELDERERALHPDKTAADLEWVAEREADVIGGETNRIRKAAKVLPENDRSLSRATRQLAKMNRIRGEELTAAEFTVRQDVVAKLEKLYREALRDDRPIDAEHYRKSILLLYPDWTYKPEN